MYEQHLRLELSEADCCYWYSAENVYKIPDSTVAFGKSFFWNVDKDQSIISVINIVGCMEALAERIDDLCTTQLKFVENELCNKHILQKHFLGQVCQTLSVLTFNQKYWFAIRYPKMSSTPPPPPQEKSCASTTQVDDTA